jgi:hypothetical protein
MGGSSKKAMKNANTAAAQALDYNKQTANLEAQLNRYDETNPYGSTTWVKDPVTGQYKVTQTASPQLQGAIDSSLDSQTAANKATQAGANRIAGTVGTAFDTSGLPGYANTPTPGALLGYTPQSNVPVTSGPNAGPVQTGLGNTGSPYAALFGAGAVPDAIDVQGGQYQTGVGDAGPIQGQVANAGPINKNVNLQTSLGPSGSVNQSLDLQKSLDYSSAPALYGSGNVSNDYNSAVSTAFGAQKANLDDVYAQQRRQLVQTLADQGIPMDSDAAKTQLANLDKNRDAAYIQAQAAAANTGLNTQSTLSGLSLANRQQSVGETNSQGQFGNDAKTTEAGFNNQGQDQEFRQKLASGQFGNDAMLNQANYGLGAQAQQYSQNSNDMAQANAAQGQRFGQALSSGQFANDATSRTFDDKLAAANQNYSQQANTQQTRYGQQSDTQGKAYAQALSSGEFYNKGQDQKFGQDLASGTFQNQAQQQQFEQNRARLGDYNTAVQGNFQNQSAAAQQQNALRDQAFNERATARNIPISEVTSMMNAQQPTPQLPGVQTPGIQVAPVDFTGTYNAERQAQASKKNGITGAIGQIGAGAAKMCWVAREVYGVDNPAWLEVRRWVVEDAPAWFRNLYIRHGEAFAVYIADKPRVKSIIRFFMEMVR